MINKAGSQLFFQRRGLWHTVFLVFCLAAIILSLLSEATARAEEEVGNEIYEEEEADNEQVEREEVTPQDGGNAFPVEDARDGSSVDQVEGSAEPIGDVSNDEMPSPESADVSAASGQPDVQTPHGTEEAATVDVVDLSDVDIEEVEEDWESTPDRPAEDITRSIRIEDIVEPPSDYHYASFDRPNPFQAPDLNIIDRMAEGAGLNGVAGGGTANGDPVAGAEAAAGKLVYGAEIPMISALQNFALKDLRLKGIWQSDAMERRAIVMTPKREGIIVKVGDPIAAGKILEINKEYLVVREYRIKSDGAREYEDKEMYLGPAPIKGRGVIKLDPGKEPQFLPPKAGGVQPEGDPLNLLRRDDRRGGPVVRNGADLPRVEGGGDGVGGGAIPAPVNPGAPAAPANLDLPPVPAPIAPAGGKLMNNGAGAGGGANPGPTGLVPAAAPPTAGQPTGRGIQDPNTKAGGASAKPLPFDPDRKF